MAIQTKQNNSEYEGAQSICSEHSIPDILLKIGALYAFNKTPSTVISEPHAIRFVLANGDPACERKIPILKARELVEKINRANEIIVPGRNGIRNSEVFPDIINGKYPPDLKINEDLIVGASSTITNPGSPGAMICYGLNRYLPLNDILIRELRIDVVSAYRTASLFHKRGVDFLDRIEGSTQERFFECIQNRPISKMVAPPKDFLNCWEKIYRFNKDEIGSTLYGRPVDWNLIDFLATDVVGLAKDRDFLNRWGILSLPSGDYQLLMPTSIIETITSAIHLELIRKMSQSDPAAYGDYSRRVGTIFEDIVRNEVETHWKGMKIRGPIKIFDKDGKTIGDIDILLENDQGKKILIECKGGMLRPKGRWGNTLYIGHDLERNVHHSSDQLVRILDSYEGLKESLIATFVIMDAYIPLVTTFVERDPDLRKKLQTIPNPIFFSYYDFTYMMGKIDEISIFDFLTWRRRLMDNVYCIFGNEMDTIRSYVQSKTVEDDIIQKMAEKKVIFMMNGRDADYALKRHIEAMKRLGLSDFYEDLFNSTGPLQSMYWG